MRFVFNDYDSLHTDFYDIIKVYVTDVIKQPSMCALDNCYNSLKHMMQNSKNLSVDDHWI